MANLMIILIILIAFYILVTTLVSSAVVYLVDNKKGSFKASLITFSISTIILLTIPIILSNFLKIPYIFLKCYVLIAQPVISCLVYKKVSKKPWKRTISTMALVSVCQSAINLISWLI